MRNQSNASSYMNLPQQRPPIHENRDRSAVFFAPAVSLSLFFFSADSPALRDITDELFVLVVGSFALQRRVTTKGEKRFAPAINNNESVRSMCPVTDIPHFSLFIFLTLLLSRSLFAKTVTECRTRRNSRSVQLPLKQKQSSG